MQAIEFETDIVNGVVQIPKSYKELQKKKNVRFIVLTTDSEKPAVCRKMSVIAIDTMNYKFDREEANER